MEAVVLVRAAPIRRPGGRVATIGAAGTRSGFSSSAIALRTAATRATSIEPRVRRKERPSDERNDHWLEEREVRRREDQVVRQRTRVPGWEHAVQPVGIPRGERGDDQGRLV